LKEEYVMTDANANIVREVQNKLFDVCGKVKFKADNSTEDITKEFKAYAADYFRDHMDELKSAAQEEGLFDPECNEITVDDEATVTITRLEDK
jgi:cob(I)alamin adenosyltransferase